MSANRAAVLHGVGDVRIEERPVPEPGPREVLVEVSAVGVCGSDVHYYEHGRIGDHVVRAPMVLGHESAGRVAAVGEQASRHAVGDRVTLELVAAGAIDIDAMLTHEFPLEGFADALATVRDGRGVKSQVLPHGEA